MNDKYLKEKSNELNLLYVENKDEFRKSVTELLEEYFKNIYVAKNSDESIELFKKHHPKIVIIDIDVSSFNWVEIAMHIKEIAPEIKIIVLSRHDGQRFLLDAINIGVTKFLIKPIESPHLSEAIELTINQIKYEYHTKIFYNYLHSAFNYQNSMVMMLKDKKPLLVNQVFLDFFNVESIHEFNKEYKDIGTLFLKRDGYLYSEIGRNWLNEVSENAEKLYHVQLKSKNEKLKHFLFKYHLLEEEKSYSILSFDDITELDLVKTYDIEKAHKLPKKEAIDNILNLLKLIQKNQIKVHIYNYYKGLTIVHDGVVIDVKSDSVTLKTDYLQQKAIQVEGKALISSEVLPYTIACDKVTKISFEKQSVVLKDMHFSRTSPASRKTIRLLPDSKYSISLFINNQKYRAQIKILDISIDSINLKFDCVPIQLKQNDKVIIDMILTYQNHPLIINTEATVIKVSSKKRNSNMIFVFNLDLNKKNTMLKYIATRQIEIIKEFKALKNEAV